MDIFAASFFVVQLALTAPKYKKPSKVTEKSKKQRVNIPDSNKKPLKSDIKDYIVELAKKKGVNAKISIEIARAESNFREKAVNYNNNGTNDKGVFQINSIHNVPDKCRLDYKCNIRWSINKMVEEGFDPWYSSAKVWRRRIR